VAEPVFYTETERADWLKAERDRLWEALERIAERRGDAGHNPALVARKALEALSRPEDERG
jgi:hypothetical protein